MCLKYFLIFRGEKYDLQAVRKEIKEIYKNLCIVYTKSDSFYFYQV